MAVTGPPADCPLTVPPIGRRDAGGARIIANMISRYWPVSGLRVRTPRLELRLPETADLDALAALAAEGVHDPDVQPFTVAWTDAPPQQRAESTVRYHWSRCGAWQPGDWSLNLVADAGGTIVGTQEVGARNFGMLREVELEGLEPCLPHFGLPPGGAGD